MITRFEIKQYVTRYKCPACGGFTMETWLSEQGEAWVRTDTNGAEGYPAECTHCHHKMFVDGIYPKFETVETPTVRRETEGRVE